MKVKGIMLVTFVLLAILTFGAVSASEDVAVDENLTASDVTEDLIEEAPVDDVIADDFNQTFGVDPEDFNVWIANDTFDVGMDKEEVVINFTSPEFAVGEVVFKVDDRQSYSVDVDASTWGNTINVTLNDLWFPSYGTLPISVEFAPTGSDDPVEIGTGTFTVVKNYYPEDFNTFSRDTITNINDKIFSLYGVPALGTFILYVDGEERYNEHIDSKSPYKLFVVDDLNISDNGDYNIRAEYVVDENGQLVVLDDFNASVSCMPVSIALTDMPIDVADDFINPNLGYVADDEMVQGTVIGYIDDNQVFSQQCSGSDWMVYLEGFTYYEGFTLGDHAVKIVYLKNDVNEYSKEGIVSFYADPTVINPYNMQVGDKKYFTVNYYQGSTGNMVVYNAVKDSTSPTGWKRGTTFMTVELNGNGTAYVPLESLDAGYHGFYLNITLGTYNVEKYVDVDVKDLPDTRIYPGLCIDVDDIVYGNDAVVTVTANNTYSGNVLVEIEGLQFNVEVINGIGYLNVPNLNASDSYFVEAFSNATEVFKSDSASINFKVSKAWSDILFRDEVIDIDVGTPLNLTINTTGAIGIAATIDSEDAVVEGNVIVIPALSEGSHLLVITTIVDSNHKEDYREATINVTKPKSGVVIDKLIFLNYGESVNVTVTTTDALGFTAKIDGENATVDGNVIIVSGLAVGNHTLTVTTVVDENHASVTETADIIVKRLKSTIVLTPQSIVFDYGNSGSISAVVTNGGIGNVSVVGHSEAVIDINGSIITVSNLNAGKYVLSVATVPDEGYDSATGNVTVTVNKLKTTVTAAKVTTTYGTSKNIAVTLKANGKILANKKITVVLNGKTYSAKTNSKGVASIAIPTTLAVKTYSASITYAGETNYAKSTGKVSVVVGKATPKWTVKAKTFKTTDKTKKYTVTLKTDKNAALKSAKVTIKVNGKTYSAKTASNGVATFKLTQLTKKGKFKASVKFAGDAKYKALSKNVYITVK